jgi:hypothetical protein
MPEVVTEAQRSQLAHLRIQINPRVLRQTIYCDLEQMPKSSAKQWMFLRFNFQ